MVPHRSATSSHGSFNCLTCPVPGSERGFCGYLPPTILNQVQAAGVPIEYPSGATIFRKGQQAFGVHIICSGRVKLGDICNGGRAIIVRISGPGHALGLTKALVKKLYSLTAETLEPVQVKFISSADFGHIKDASPRIAECIIEQLSHDLLSAQQSMLRSFLHTSARPKLASLLIAWAGEEKQPVDGPARVHMNLTHQQIGQMLGTSRETVTRTLKEFREAGVIKMRGATVEILDGPRLKKYIHEDVGATKTSGPAEN